MLKYVFAIWSENRKKGEASPERKVYQLASRINPMTRTLDERFKSGLEAATQQRKDGGTETWNFWSLVAYQLINDRMMREYPPEDENSAAMINALSILAIQAEGKTGELNVRMILDDYKSRDDATAFAVKKILMNAERIGKMLDVVEKTQFADLQPRHKMVFAAPKNAAPSARK